MYNCVKGVIPSDEVQHDGSELLADCSSEQPPVVAQRTCHFTNHHKNKQHWHSEQSHLILFYLFRDCIICIDKILPGECVHRKFSLTDCTTRMIRGYQKEAEKSNRKKTSLDSWIRRMILQRIRKSLPWKSNRETIRLTLMMSPRKRLHFNLNLNQK